MAMEPEVVMSFDEEDIEEITALAKNCDKLAELVSTSAQIGPKIGTFSVSRRLSEKIGLNISEINSMVHGLVRIYRMREGLSSTGEAVAKTITRSLEKAKQLDAAKAWKDAQDKIIQASDALTDEHPLLVSYEAGSVMASTPNTVISMELSTGTRPVFNESKDKILFTIIQHTLSLEYHESYRNHKEVQLNLDASDIAMLRVLCEEAEQAAQTLKASIRGPSEIPGDDDAEHVG